MAKKKEVADVGVNVFADLAADIGGEVLGATDSVKEWIDTGNLALNYLCSGRFVGGGIPSGKIIEVYGPSSSCKTLFATNILKGCQKMGGYSLFLDAENSLSKEFAQKASHLETSKVLVLKAESLEKAFAKMTAAIKKIREKLGPDKPIVIVYDSIAASPSDREFAETEMSESELEKAKDMPGERAKTCSKELRKLTPLLDQHNCTVLFINQVRMKIGVMFGCFSKDTNVCFSDGRLVSIRDVVENRMTGPIKCYNKKTGELGNANITNWFENGTIDYKNGERWLHYKVTGGVCGHMGFTCTPNHSVLKKHGDSWIWTSAENMHVGDVMMSYYESKILKDSIHKSVIYGSLLGDGCIRIRERDTGSFSLANQEQPEYLNWKLSLLPMLSMKKAGNDSRPRVDSIYSKEIKTIHDTFYTEGQKYRQIPFNLKLDDLMAAVWYMDDGWMKNFEKDNWQPTASISIKRFKKQPEQIKLAIKIMCDFIGETNGVTYQESSGNIHIGSDISDKFFQRISKFVPACMQHKIPDKYRGLYVPIIPTEVSSEMVSYPVTVVQKREGSPRQHRSLKKYDIEVAGHGAYLVGGNPGVVVSNSPETTAGGGRALEYYTSLRLRTKAEKRLTDKLDNVIGMGVSVSNVKNKCFKPFVNARNMQLLFDQGINPFGGLLELLVQSERITSISAGNYKVNEPYAGGQEIKFKSSYERNDVPADVLLKCPAMVDATDASQVQEYIDIFGAAMRGMAERVAGEEVVKSTDDE